MQTNDFVPYNVSVFCAEEWELIVFEGGGGGGGVGARWLTDWQADMKLGRGRWSIQTLAMPCLYSTPSNDLPRNQYDDESFINVN